MFSSSSNEVITVAMTALLAGQDIRELCADFHQRLLIEAYLNQRFLALLTALEEAGDARP